MNTSQSLVRWKLYCYPWSPVYPGEDDFSGSLLSKKSDLIPKISLPNPMPNSPGEPGERVDITRNVKNMHFRRNKVSNENSLNIMIRGRVDDSIIIGNWVVLKSTCRLPPSDNQDINEVSLFEIPRFIGQITDISSSYEKNPETGQIYHVTNVQVREWSHVFGAQIRFDEASILASLAESQGQIVWATGALHEFDIEQMTALAKTLMNPFQFVYLILLLVGAASKNKLYKDVLKEIPPLPDIALRMPSIPKTLLNDLGLSEGLSGSLASKALDADSLASISSSSKKDLSGSTDSEFATSFMTVIAGVQKGPMHNDGKWAGVFNYGEIDKMASGATYNNNPKGRAASTGMVSVVAQGLSAWEIFQETADLDYNEVFTDILYEKNEDGTGIVARPTFFIRDKPFATNLLMKKREKLKDAEWTRYDDLPRLYIPDVFIQKVAFNTSIRNCFNYIRAEYSSPDVVVSKSKQLSIALGTLRERQEEMSRFGGNAKFARTNYFAKELPKKDEESVGPGLDLAAFIKSGVSAPDWIEQLKYILDVWWGEYYKSPSATMVIKDYSVPITVGMNVTWVAGGMMLVGHVIEVASSISVDDNGIHRTETTIHLDRVMKTVGDPVGGTQVQGMTGKDLVKSFTSIVSKPGSMNTDLEFIDPRVLNNLYRDIGLEKKVLTDVNGFVDLSKIG